MTNLAAILAPQFVSGVAFYTERLDSDAPYRDHAAADKAAQAEALRRVSNRLPVGDYHGRLLQEQVAIVARELGVEL